MRAAVRIPPLKARSRIRWGGNFKNIIVAKMSEKLARHLVLVDKRKAGAGIRRYSCAIKTLSAYVSVVVPAGIIEEFCF